AKADMGLGSDRIDALFRSLALGKVIQALDRALAGKIDGNRTSRLGHGKPFGKPVYSNDLLGTEQDRAPDSHLPDRAASPDRHRIGGLDFALHGCLPSGREYVSEEQECFIGYAFR